MDKLIQLMKQLLATTFDFRLKSQYYHWNIEGADFPQYHSLLGDIYTEADGQIDGIAEHIRTLNVYAPGSFGRYMELSVIQQDDTIQPGKVMLTRLEEDNAKLITLLSQCQQSAETLGKIGLVNYLEGLIDDRETLGWKLRATIKV
jgi:starvation-inducible DNA-binding protein